MTTISHSSNGENLIHINHMTGHRPSFIVLFKQLFDMDPIIGPVNFRNFMRLVRADRLIFGTLDDDVWGFVLVALARALLRRPTAGIFMRPHACFFVGVGAQVRRLLFATLRRVPMITTLSLLPFEPAPELRAIATLAVHDPQMWDVVDNDDPADDAMLAEIALVAAGRPVLTFLGTVFEEKGFGFLARLIAAEPAIAQRLCVIIAGKVMDPCALDADAIALAGAFVWNRRTSDSELAALYQASDAVWACYNPDYDQASGIFGRAVQRGRRPVIRDKAAIIGHYASILAIDAIRLPDEPSDAAKILLGAASATGMGRTVSVADADVLRGWREEFINAVLDGTSRHTVV